MSIDATAEKIVKNQIPLDSVAQFRSVVVKAGLIGCPLVVFLLVMFVREPSSRFFVSSVEVAVTIAALGTALNLDFRKHRLSLMVFHTVKWWMLLYIFLEFQSYLTLGESLIKTIGKVGFGLDYLSNVQGRIWLVLIMMFIFVPATIRLLSLRDIRCLASVVPFSRPKRVFESAIIVFFLVSNTFGRRLKTAWEIASEKRVAARRAGWWQGVLLFSQDFLTVVLQQALDIVLQAGSLIKERGFQDTEVRGDRWGWGAFGAEDAIGSLILSALIVGYLSNIA